MYENVPLVYILDDHDTGKDNANGNDRSLGSINKAYRAVVPHYPLPETVAADTAKQSTPILERNATEESYVKPVEKRGLWHSFMGGSTKFIATDARSFLFTKRLDGKHTVFGDT